MWATHLVGTEPKVGCGPSGTSAAGSSEQSAAKMSVLTRQYSKYVVVFIHVCCNIVWSGAFYTVLI